MTVGELIRRLMDMPVDATVVVNMGSNELGNGCEAGTVELVDAYRNPSQDRWHVDYEPDLIEYRYSDCEYRKVVNINNGRKA